jgi:eukaryotic-like serine/threonine-protein kinase
MTAPDDMLGRTLLGRYRIVMPIGHGGMGTVYLARTEGAAGFAKPVVIKQILPGLVADGGMVQLFIREARILANLHHPGIVNVLDFGEENGAYVMVLEYVHGYNLAEWGKFVLTVRGQIPVDYLVYITARVLETLHYAHTYHRPDGKALAIIHRDVSPGNVLLDTEAHVKLGDFGIARATDDAGEYRSRVGSFKGKLAYAAPELIAGEEASPRSDVYATGIVLLHLLLGQNPFRGQTMADSVQRVLNLAPPRASDERSDVPPELDDIIARALRKSPKDRFPDAPSFAEALRKVRRRPDEDLVAELGEQLRQDFGPQMSEMLGLEPLADRDAAWRGTEDGVGSSLRSTMPPPGPRARPLADQATLAEPTVRDEIPADREVKRRPRGGIWIAAGIAGGIVGIAGVVGAVVLTQREPEGGPQFVVIDRKTTGEVADQPTGAAPVPPPPGPAATPTPASSGAAPNANPSSPMGAPPATAAPAATPSSGQPDTAALSRAVQSQGGRIQACFQSHVSEIGGSPQVSIRFSINESGQVTSAQVQPASVAGTPLGGCLVGVAKSTVFPPQGKAVSFTIPITARVSR